MGYVRELRVEDCDEARRIAKLKDKTSGTAPISDAGLDSILFSVGRPNAPRKIFGYFEDEKLLSWGSTRYLDIDGEKFWLITGLFSSNFHNHFSFKRAEVGMIVEAMLNHAEATGYWTYVYSVSARLANVYEKQWAKQDFKPMTGRYELFELGVVPANTQAPTEWQLRMMGGIKPDDVIFKKRVLKPEFRNESSSAN